MKNNVFWMLVLFLLAIPASAQGWQRGSMGNVEYNCDAVNGAVADFGEELFVIGGVDTLTPGDGDAEHYVLTDVGVSTVANSMLSRAPGCGTAPEETDGIIDVYEPERWLKNITDDYFYQCDIVRAIVAAYGDLEYRRDGDRRHTVIGYYQEDAPDCVPRYVIARQHQRVLECAGSDCEFVYGFLRGEALPVVGLSDGWYEVALEDGTGFVAEAQVVPGPYGFLHVGEQHVLEYADCIMIPQRRPKDYTFITIIKSGPAYQEMEVALYEPLSDKPLGIYDEMEKEFSNNGQPYILQIPGPVDDFPNGIYIVQLAWGNLTFNYGFDLREPDVYDIHVYCNRPASE